MSLGGLSKKFNFSQIFRIGLSFVVLDMQANLIQNMQNINVGVKALAGISVQLAKFGLVAKMGKGLPFGLGSILTTITGLQATTYAISQLPGLISLFGGAGGYGGPGQVGQAPGFPQQAGGGLTGLPQVGGGGPTAGSFQWPTSPYWSI